jgi:hypothetical protein
MEIGQKVKYGVAESKEQGGKETLETFEIYKVFDNHVWLRNKEFNHVTAWKKSLIL